MASQNKRIGARKDPQLLGAAPEEKRLRYRKTDRLMPHPEEEKEPIITPPPMQAANMPPVEPAAASRANRSAGVFAIALIGLLALIGLMCWFVDLSKESRYPQLNRRYASASDGERQAFPAKTLDFKKYGKTAAASAYAGGNTPVVVYLFNYDSDGVPETAALTEIANAAKAMGKSVMVVAYTDEHGSTSYNQALSQRRAKSIGDYMKGHGVRSDKVKAIGKGPTNRFATDQLNRRAEVSLK